MLRVISVVGARPNFMKIAPLMRAIAAHNTAAPANAIDHLLVHTGQHYDDRMSKSFFEALGIAQADVNLGIGSGTHAEQVGKTMIAFEKVLKQEKPDWVVVVGDVNATCACSITAKKEHIRVAHIEAGLRSFDLDMPEEINRMVTDRLADLLFATDEIACENLRREGADAGRIKLVGNVMIDTLQANRAQAEDLTIADILKTNALQPKRAQVECRPDSFAVLTMHRPSNVDDPEILTPIIDFLIDEAAVEMPIVWPIHPRATKQLKAFGLWDRVAECDHVVLLHPVGYHDMLKLNMSCRIMLTDSGGLQEECSVLGTPCVTLRMNTERPVTLIDHAGTNVLAGNDVTKIREAFNQLKSRPREPAIPPLWDGHAAERIVAALVEAGTEDPPVLPQT